MGRSGRCRDHKRQSDINERHLEVGRPTREIRAASVLIRSPRSTPAGQDHPISGLVFDRNARVSEVTPGDAQASPPR